MAAAISSAAFAYETDLLLGTDQQLMVTMGVTHPFALWFPGRDHKVSDDLVKTPLLDHRAAGVHMCQAAAGHLRVHGHSQAEPR